MIVNKYALKNKGLSGVWYQSLEFAMLASTHLVGVDSGVGVGVDSGGSESESESPENPSTQQP